MLHPAFSHPPIDFLMAIDTTSSGFSSPSPSTLRRNQRHYNEMITFQVEDQLFREPKRYFAAHSEVFRTMFTLPSGETNPEGQSDENPLKLEGVPAQDFEHLLSVIYPLSPLEDQTFTSEDWKGIVKLATLWGMGNLRKHGIQKLTPLPEDMPLATKVLYARECMASDWLMDAFNQLIQRREIITEEEEDKIGLRTTNRLLRIRQSWYKNLEDSADGEQITYHVTDHASGDFRDAIREAFADELSVFEA